MTSTGNHASTSIQAKNSGNSRKKSAPFFRKNRIFTDFCSNLFFEYHDILRIAIVQRSQMKNNTRSRFGKGNIRRQTARCLLFAGTRRYPYGQDEEDG
jgi:hypothetical protein